MNFPSSGLLSFFEESFGTEKEDRLDVFARAAFIVHFLHNEVIEDELLLPGLHDTFCEG